MRARIGTWNLYNRVGIEYVAPTDPAALEPVVNPHTIAEEWTVNASGTRVYADSQQDDLHLWLYDFVARFPLRRFRHAPHASDRACFMNLENRI
jgi:hypothetical protein